MKKPIQISIPTPCHENWAEMTPADKGRFCASCQKTVIDFTRASDSEISGAFRKNGNVCGKFRNDQLERNLFIQKEKSSLWTAACAAILAFLSFGSTEAKAQNHATEQTDNTTGRKKLSAINPRPMVNGIVISGNRKSSNPTIINKNTSSQTTADENGAFIISLTEGDILEFTCEGFENQTVVYNKEENLKVYMTPIGEILCTLGGAVMGVEIKKLDVNTIPENKATRSIWDLFN